MENPVLRVEDFSASFGQHRILSEVNLEIERERVTAIMGPSGCGKTTLIRCINRMHELTAGASVGGRVYLNGEDIYRMNSMLLRRRIGMVFQRPNPFPTMCIQDNVLAGYQLNGIRLNRDEKRSIVEKSLRRAALWDEVKDDLPRRGVFLSGGQQQRLCIARALAMNPEIAQAARVSDFTAFLYLGELVEFGPSKKMFTTPKDQRTEEYLTGRFG
ncbi:MAG: phosphate ABC transporter ATP-binding protein [Acidobacteriota bacterium]